MADERPDVTEEIEEETNYRFTTLPERIEFGLVARCPRCNGKGNEPGSKKTPCHRCRGMGVVPNKGPIP